MKRKKLVFAMSIAAVLAVAAAGGAAAGDPQPSDRDPNYVNTGGGLEGGPAVRTPAEQALHEQKRKLADEYAAVRAGTLDAATYEADFDAFLAKVGAPSSARTAESMAEATASEDSLAVAVKSQGKSYWCGPATAAEILSYLDVHTGPHGESLSQTHLAERCEHGYLCTEAAGQETPWYYYPGYPHPMKTTLNEWWRIDYYVVENDTDTWIADMIWDISSMGNPIASNINEWDDHGHHLNNHPNLDIGHWVAVQGYKDSGDSTRYVDSIWGTNFWDWSDDVEAHNYIATYKFKWLMNNNSKGWVG